MGGLLFWYVRGRGYSFVGAYSQIIDEKKNFLCPKQEAKKPASARQILSFVGLRWFLFGIEVYARMNSSVNLCPPT